MPSPKNRSRSVKRKQKKGGKTLYKRPKETKASCAICKNVVKKQKSKKPIKVNRKFGSNLCVKCLKLVSSYAARVKTGTVKLENLNISYQKYVAAIIK